MKTQLRWRDIIVVKGKLRERKNNSQYDQLEETNISTSALLQSLLRSS